MSRQAKSNIKIAVIMQSIWYVMPPGQKSGTSGFKILIDIPLKPNLTIIINIDIFVVE